MDKFKTIFLDGKTSYVLKSIPTEVKPKNGTDFQCEELQKVVGGFIEIVFRLKASKDYIMVVNEEGQLIDLPYNPLASAIAGQNIVGDVLLCPREMVK